MESLKFKTNINCGGCVKAVTGFINEVPGISNWVVDTQNPDKILSVEGEGVDAELVLEAVEFVKKVNIKISLCSELKTFFIKHLPRSFAIQSRMDSMGVVPSIDIFENQREQLFSLD